MGTIVRAALRIRLIVVVLAAVLILAGPRMLRDAPLDVFPEFAPPLVEIQTEAPGLSTEDVEALISVPIENALIGTAWVETIRSKSVLGLSSVVLLFERGTDILEARQLVQERVTRVTGLLPDVADPPVILSPLSSTSRVLKIGLSSATRSQMELSTLARWTIRPSLMSVPGVANVAIWGQRDRQLQILVDPDRLRAHNVTLREVEAAGRAAVSVGAGGFVDTPNQRLSVTHRADLSSPEELAAVTVAFRNGTPLTLGDVADVRVGSPPPIGDAIINDGPGILLIVEKQPWGNTLDVTRGVDEALAALAPGLQDVDVDAAIFRPATFIEMSLENLNRALLIGCVLVIVLLGVFLYDWRTAVISLLAIPLSLLAAALVLRYQGGTIDTMVLAGLVIALGEVVDDAIIDVENIMRRLRLNAAEGNPHSAFRVVLDASIEVRSAVVYGSLIVVLVFLPVFFLEGLAGTFFRPLALSYVLAIVASLVVALVVTPALSLILLPVQASRRQEEAPLVTALKARYRKILPVFVEHPRRAAWIIAVSLGATAVVYPFLGEEFLPDFQEYDFLMHWVEKPGTSLEAMNRITLQASRELRSIDGVRNFGSHTGRAEVADEVVGPNFTELWISLEPTVDYEPKVAEIQSVVDGYPGLYRDLLTYLRERIKEVLTGASATIVVRISGPSLDELETKAHEVEAAIADVPGIVDLHVQQQIQVPQIDVRFRPSAGGRFGITPADVRHAVSTLVKGEKVGEFYEDQKVFDITVWGSESIRSDPMALRRLMIDTPAGAQVPLGDIADVMVVPMRNEITREAASRKIDVTFNVEGRDLSRVAGEVDTRLEGVTFGEGYHPEILGEFAAQEASRNRLLSLALLALLGIFLILQADFESTRLALLLFLTVPFALIGGVGGVILTGGVMSLGAVVGFVTVLGIAARNGIMMVSHYRHLETEEGVPFGRELVMRGAEERLAPILMTALATGLALLPIIAGGTRPGHEIEHPLAVVIVGGLATSTLLNLLLMPALYLRFGRAQRERRSGGIAPAVTAPLVALAALLTASGVGAQEASPPADTLELTVEAARQLAMDNNPAVEAAAARAEAARGLRRQAGVYAFNPELELKTPGLLDPGSGGAFEAYFTQELEWAGQWGLRKAAAGHALDVALAEAREAMRGTVAAVDSAWYRAVAARRREEVLARGLELGDRLLEAVRIHLQEGGASRLEVNLASIEAGRARAQWRGARREHTNAVLELTRVLGMDADQPVRATGEGGGPFPPGELDPDSLVVTALARRPDYGAALAEVDAARAQRALVTREALPNLRVSALADRGATGEDVRWGVRIAFPLPLWNRNQGLIQQGGALLDEAEALRLEMELRVRADVASTLEAYASAREELEVLEAQVLQPARENRDLLEAGYTAGALDLATTLLLRVQLLEAELAYWDAWLAEREALTALRAAVGETGGG